MRKRSSDQDWPTSLSVISLLGLFAILTFAFRAVTMPASYAVVAGEIPVVPAVVDDPSYHNFQEQSVHSVREHTMAVVLTTRAFYFGDLASFSTDIGKKSGRYAVPHIDNIPRTGDLIEDMSAWRKHRQTKQNMADDRVMVFFPSGDIPMPIVIQVMAQLKEHGEFDRIVLGGGFLL